VKQQNVFDGYQWTLDQRIELMAMAALQEIREMARDAIEHINRLTGQHIRRARERTMQFNVETTQ